MICPAFTFYATAESIVRRGATPVFAEIDPATLNLDLEDVAAKITAQPRAIMPVHLFGRPLPIEPLFEHGVPVHRWNLLNLALWWRDALDRGRDTDGERGDVPGWVMVTVMSAILVVAILAVFEPEIKNAITNAIDSVSGSN